MRYYKEIIETNMTYKRCLNKATKLGLGITRPSEWDGVHILAGEEYRILTKQGEVIKNPAEIMDMKKKDWAIVRLTNRAEQKLGV